MGDIEDTAEWYSKLMKALLLEGIDGKTASKILIEEGKRRKDKKVETDIKQLVDGISKKMNK